MDAKKFHQALVVKVYHITGDSRVALHRHPKHDEVFYCVKGRGHGVLETGETPLEPGRAFIVPAGALHSLRTDTDLYVASALIPLADDPEFGS